MSKTTQTAAKCDVSIVMGSDSDWPLMEECAATLERFGVGYEVRVISAHRTPEVAAAHAREADGRGVKVVIAAAGGAAHLAGVLAAHTVLPVIGVPVASSFMDGLDSLLSTVQMPAGVPVATTAVGKAGAVNAAILAVQILALSRPELAQRLAAHKKGLVDKVHAGNARIQQELEKKRARD